VVSSALTNEEKAASTTKHERILENITKQRVTDAYQAEYVEPIACRCFFASFSLMVSDPFQPWVDVGPLLVMAREKT